MARKTSVKLPQAQDEQELLLSETEIVDTQDENSAATMEDTAERAENPVPQPEESTDTHLYSHEPSPELDTDSADTLPKETSVSDSATEPLVDSTPSSENKLAAKTAKPKAKATKGATIKPATALAKSQNARQSFYSLDFRTLDRDLSPEQEEEWNAIYASFRSNSILTGTVIGVDDHTFDITDEQGQTQRKTVRSLIVIGYRVKVMIPETEVWAVGEENGRYTVHGVVGAKVDYVIMRVDRENECAIASRRMAMTKRRRHTLQTVRNNHELVTCDTILVSKKAMLINYGGFDLVLSQKDISYTAIADLRTAYKSGMELRARLLDMREGKPVISVKEVNSNPFDGAAQRHPIGCRRQAVIEGKYAGGVFCRLPDDTTCLCLYSNNLYDGAFDSGDTVLVHITELDYGRKLVYGRIVGKQ